MLLPRCCYLRKQVHKKVDVLRAEGGDQDGDQAHAHKGDGFLDRFSKCGVGDLGGNEDTDSKGRSQEANAHIDQHDGTEGL